MRVQSIFSGIGRQNLSFVLLTSFLLIWSTIVAVGVYFALQQPTIGMTLQGDAEKQQFFVRYLSENSPAANAGIKLGDRFVAIENVDGTKRYKFLGPETYSGRQRIHSYKAHDEMQDAKLQLWPFLQEPAYVLIKDTGERVTISPDDKRTFATSQTLYILVFLILLQSLIILLISSGIFVFAKQSLGVIVLFIAGVGFSINGLGNAFIITREIMLDPNLHELVNIVAKAGSAAFRYSLLCLVWYVPKPINKFPFWQFMLAAGIFVFLAQTFQFYEFPFHPYELPNLMLFLIGIVISVAQWRKCMNDPIDRATVQWMMMSIYGSILIVVGLYSIPLLLQQEPLINPLVASFLFLLMFVGLALGTLRYRLFDVHRIWWKSVVWILGGFLVILADLILVSQFDFEQKNAVPLALILAGWMYFPLRQFILSYFVGSTKVNVSDHIPQLINTFSEAQDTDQFGGRFIAFVKSAFNANEVGSISREGSAVTKLKENGLVLSVPNVFGGGAFEIIGKADGRRLFSRDDENTAEAFLKLVRNLWDVKDQEFNKRRIERERIVRDLHDDVGGRLLSLIYQADDQEVADAARDTLAALKDSLIVVEGTESIDLDSAWTQILRDCEKRLRNSHFQLNYHDPEKTGIFLSAREYFNIKRIVQELTTNAIKHGVPCTVLISLTAASEGEMLITFCNKYVERSETSMLDGRGMANIQQRLVELNGQLLIDRSLDADGKQVFEVRLKIPI